jgi:hypothetical protein
MLILNTSITTMKRKIDKLDKKIPFPERLLLSAVLGSILASIFLYFYTGNADEAIFVGLWAPTIMSLINFINLKFKQ